MSSFEYLIHNTAWLYTSALVFGLLVGSFLNVVIHRLPIMLKKQWRKDCMLFLADNGDISANANQSTDEEMNLVVPRSRCPQCGHAIPAWENIPLLSYFLLRGKCRYCKEPISLRYPAVELFAALIALAIVFRFGPTLPCLLALLLSWALICLALIDYDHQYLPDNITLPFLWLGLIVNLNGLFTDIESALIGAMAGYIILWSIYKLFKVATGKEGMGYGDFKLLAMLGAWLGWQMLPAIILLSSLVGAVVGIGLVLADRHARGKPISFGPYLAMAGWLTLIAGERINEAYLRWVGLIP